MRGVPAGDRQSLARSGEVCTNCNNHNEPFVTKVHKGHAVGSVLWLEGGCGVRFGV
jgi:hypothetical protein